MRWVRFDAVLAWLAIVGAGVILAGDAVFSAQPPVVLTVLAVLLGAFGIRGLAASYNGQLAIEAERHQWDLRERVRDTGDQPGV